MPLLNIANLHIPCLCACIPTLEVDLLQSCLDAETDETHWKYYNKHEKSQSKELFLILFFPCLHITDHPGCHEIWSQWNSSSGDWVLVDGLWRGDGPGHWGGGGRGTGKTPRAGLKILCQGGTQLSYRCTAADTDQAGGCGYAMQSVICHTVMCANVFVCWLKTGKEEEG